MIPSAPVWAICASATAGVIGRPFRLPEATWAVAGALLLVLLGFMSPSAAFIAIGKGTDVYLFLTGMMLLSESARVAGLFEWVAAAAVNGAHGSPPRLFFLVYGAGVIVTTFLSNDATAVVLTPAIYAVARKGKAEPLPLLFACALTANAASFMLPISNPANLVLYGGQMPPLGTWLHSFALPSFASIAVTYVVLRFVERKRLTGECARGVEQPRLSRGGWTALAGVVLTAVLLIVTSALGLQLGPPTCLAGLVSVMGVCGSARRSPAKLVRSISWGVLPLVGGLFVLVEALNATGVISSLAEVLRRASSANPSLAASGSGAILALASNLTNNLPAGLIASTAIEQARAPGLMVDCLLIGVDLGPNLSITGSLATILWLSAIRREGEDVGFWRFLKVGVATMPSALIAALGARLWMG